jgi:hypothetical protein
MFRSRFVMTGTGPRRCGAGFVLQSLTNVPAPLVQRAVDGA